MCDFGQDSTFQSSKFVIIQDERIFF